MQYLIAFYIVGVLIVSFILLYVFNKIEDFKNSDNIKEKSIYKDYLEINKNTPFMWFCFCLLSWITIVLIYYQSKKTSHI